MRSAATAIIIMIMITTKEVSKVFFSEEKKQKTFARWSRSLWHLRAKNRKSFLVLFFKKEHTSLLSCNV